MRFFPHALPKDVQAALDKIAALPMLHDFYLAGGTGLALRLGHRQSVDLDLFSPTNPLGFEERKELTGVLECLKSFKVEEEKNGTLHALLGKTSLSFFAYRYPLLSEPDPFRDLRIAGLEDIGPMKLAALASRGSKKDFVDIYFLAKKIPFPRLLELTEKKFPHQRDFKMQVLKALVYFDDAQKEPMPLLHKKISWEALKRYFEGTARKLLKE